MSRLFINNNNYNITINNCTFKNNLAQEHGAALYINSNNENIFVSKFYNMNNFYHFIDFLTFIYSLILKGKKYSYIR